MSIRVMSLVWEHSEQKEGALLVLLALADFAHDDGTMAFPSIKTLAKKARLSDRSVQYALRKLEEDGEIERTGTHQSGVAIYRVILGVQNLHGGAKSAPGAKSAQGCNLEQRGGAKSAPKSLRTREPLDIPPLSPTGEEDEVTPPGTGVLPPAAKPRKPRQAKREKDDPYWSQGEHLTQFNAWYAQYPRKVDPQGAMKAWRVTLANDDTDERTMRALWGLSRQRWKEWSGREPEHVPHPATWLRTREWEFTRMYLEGSQ